MPKVGKLVPPDKMAIADANGIPRTTLYRRIRDGWDIDEAISKPPRKRVVNAERNEEGVFVGIGKGKPRHFSLPEEFDEKLDKVAEKNNVSPAQWVEETVVNRLKRMNV